MGQGWTKGGQKDKVWITNGLEKGAYRVDKRQIQRLQKGWTKG